MSKIVPGGRCFRTNPEISLDTKLVGFHWRLKGRRPTSDNHSVSIKVGVLQGCWRQRMRGIEMSRWEAASTAHLNQEIHIGFQVFFQIFIIVIIEVTMVGDASFTPMVSVAPFASSFGWANPHQPCVSSKNYKFAGRASLRMVGKNPGGQIAIFTSRDPTTS